MFGRDPRKARPTVKRVLNLISAEPTSSSQRAVLSFLKWYARGLDDKKLLKFLRYCTGSTMICIELIKALFTDLDGAARCPVSHSYRSVLAVPTTYKSFPQFRQEMNNIFNSQYWDVDIALVTVLLMWLTVVNCFCFIKLKQDLRQFFAIERITEQIK